MEGLPTEILQEIVGHLSRGDLDSVRLVNHELSTAANVFKYRTLRVPVSRKGLDNLLYVSEQPALAQCVREIIYPRRYLPPVTEPCLGYYLNPDSEEMAQFFVNWYNNEIYTAQTELEDSGESVAALEAALPRMSNIRILQPGFCPDCLGNEFDKWRGILTGSGNIDVDWKYWERLKYQKPTIDSEARLAKHILDLIDVSYRVGLKPYGLGSSITSRSPMLSPGFFCSGILQNCTPLIENLTSLSFFLYESQYPDSRDVRGFKKIVHSFSLLDIFGHTRIWKHLHTLRLHASNPVDDVGGTPLLPMGPQLHEDGWENEYYWSENSQEA
ncbi:hypothetical protein RUND412_006001 [Rhizina undulata]